MIIWTKHPTTTPISAAYAAYFLVYASAASSPVLLAWLADM